MLSKKKIVIYGLLIVIMTIAAIIVINEINLNTRNSNQKTTNSNIDEAQFFGHWGCNVWYFRMGELNNITHLWFKPDGTIEINGSGFHIGGGSGIQGYIMWNATWHIVKVDNTTYVLVLNNITRTYSSNMMIKGVLDRFTDFNVICKFKTGMWEKLLFYDEVFEFPQEFYKIT
jgi:hypothetical protein